MDRDAIARARRRQEALDSLELEREREQALTRRLEDAVADAEGWRADEAAFAQLGPEDVELLRGLSFESAPPDEEQRARFEEDIAELQAALEECRRRQEALERYAEALCAEGH